jgi:hypothetical protein
LITLCIGEQRELIEARRYTFKLYPTKEQLAVLWRQRVMVGSLWNALLDRAEYIERTTVQRQSWVDAAGKRHTGISKHNDGSWRSLRKKEREDALMAPSPDGKPQHYNHFAMSNEITAMLNDPELKEWRGLSVWTCLETARHLDLAFKAFFRRLEELSSPAAYERAAAAYIAKTGRNPTRYQLAGYPKRKDTRRPEGIPHRFASGCRLTKDPRHERSWKPTLKGVPGPIHARGLFPFDITGWANADVLWHDGNYWVSVCVEGDCSRDHGEQPLTIKFQTLGSFVEVNGRPTLCDDLVEVQRLQDQFDAMKSEHDIRYPRGKQRTDEQRK